MALKLLVFKGDLRDEIIHSIVNAAFVHHSNQSSNGDFRAITPTGMSRSVRMFQKALTLRMFDVIGIRPPVFGLSTMNQVTSDLYAAKGEAIKRNARVLVCARSTSPNTCASSTNWSNGWLVCFDADANGRCDASTTANPNPILARSGIHPTLTLTGPSAPLTFTSTGPATAAATLTLTGTWTSPPVKQANVALTGFIGTS